MNDSFVLIIDNQVADFGEPINLNELQDYEIIIDPCARIRIRLLLSDLEITLDDKRQWKEEEPHYRYRIPWRFDNIGIQSIRIEAAGRLFEQKVRIRPIKISQGEYEMMLNEIVETAYNIVFKVFGKTEEEVRLLQMSAPKSPLEFFSFFERNFATFESIFRRIEKDPNTTIEKRLKQSLFYETEYFEEVIEYERPKSAVSYLQDRLRGLLPKIVLASENFLSFDVYENRLLKHYLGMVVNKLNYLEEVALNERAREISNQQVYGGDLDSDAKFAKKIVKWQQIIDRCARYRRDANRMRTSSFLQEVSTLGLVKTSMVLQREPRYKAFYRLYQDFRKNSVVEVHSEYFHLPVTQVWKTYEMWVLLKICNALERIGFNLKKQGLVDVNARFIHDAKKVRFSFDLVKNKPLLELQKQGKIAKVYYQREYATNYKDYGSVDEKAQRPDVSIEIFEKDAAVPEIVIFDPKYRIEEDKPPELARKELSHYKNTIRDSQNRLIVRTAHIVYPGELTQSFGKNHDYGYIGLKPGCNIKEFDQKISEIFNWL